MKKITRKSFVLSAAIALIVLVSGCSLINFAGKDTHSSSHTSPSAKNVILFIGDGMGLAHIEAATYHKFGQTLDADGQPPRLSFVKFPVFGYLTTHSADSFVTDSAAAGTALACGVKTNNGRICTTPDNAPLVSIAQTAKQRGKAVGILSSVGLNHATPSCFYATSGSRNDYDDILDQAFSARHYDVLIGGGVYGKGDLSKQILMRRAAEAGLVYFDMDNLDMLKPDFVKGHRVLGNFDANDNKQLDFESDRDAANPEPHLSDLTLVTLEILTGHPNGFFLMVEGGAIDWAAHDNNFAHAAGEVLEFDRAISRTVDLLKQKNLLDDTLIIVTADHETGGMALYGPYKKTLSETEPMEIKFVSTNHTALPVPVYAMGPGAELLSGKNDNTAVYRVMFNVLK